MELCCHHGGGLPAVHGESVGTGQAGRQGVAHLGSCPLLLANDIHTIRDPLISPRFRRIGARHTELSHANPDRSRTFGLGVRDSPYTNPLASESTSHQLLTICNHHLRIQSGVRTTKSMQQDIGRHKRDSKCQGWLDWLPVHLYASPANL